MKKTLILIISILICVMVILFVFLRNVESNERKMQNINLEYEEYLNKNIYGTDVGTIINKVVNHNEKNKVEKDKKGIYINNNSTSIKIDIYIKENDTTYSMENIYKLGTSEFIKNFNTIIFKGKVEEYHKNTGQISKIIFEQVDQD